MKRNIAKQLCVCVAVYEFLTALLALELALSAYVYGSTYSRGCKTVLPKFDLVYPKKRMNSKSLLRLKHPIANKSRCLHA